MLKSTAQPVIRLRGVRHNNLKNFDLDLPLKQLIVITGLSGSGKSSLAFDTLFAEGQRRYIETFSPYARQFFDRMDKPRVDRIEGIPPAIAIEQRNAVKTTRSTVGTMTEICDYMKVLWPQAARLHCRQCGRPVQKESPAIIWEAIRNRPPPRSPAPAPDAAACREVVVTFNLPLSDKLSPGESLQLVARQGYQRLLWGVEIIRVEAARQRLAQEGLKSPSFTVIQDRLKLAEGNRPRFVEACEQAYHFGRGKLTIFHLADGRLTSPVPFSQHLHCAECDIEYQEPSPALFSFNHPVGACPACKGFGRIIGIDYGLALPDRSRTLAQGVVKPWLTGHGTECQTDLMRTCRELEIPTTVPFKDLPQRWQDLVINGDPDYGSDDEHEWPRAWYGVKGYFRWLESKAYKMHVRVLLSRYRAYTQCPACKGKRFQPETLLHRTAAAGGRPNGETAAAHAMSLADFYELSIRDALAFIHDLGTRPQFAKGSPLEVVLKEVRSRLEYLNTVGLGYLTLDRPTRSLSGGETERVNLTTCLGTRLVNTLFVLDEPSVGLHPRDTERLVRILQMLRRAGNTVVVVEHEPAIMRAADRIVDLGPGHGATGGQVVFQGSYGQLLRAPNSVTGRYLSGRKRVEIPVRRPTPTPAGGESSVLEMREAAVPFSSKLDHAGWLRISGATRHNLKNLEVELPLGRFVCITGVSGSGKTTLIREVLLPLLTERLSGATPELKAPDRTIEPAEDQDEAEAAESPSTATLSGWESLGQVILVEQSALGKTPRSNPAVYIGAFEHLRDFFAGAEAARRRGFKASAFSFNSGQGQCAQCRGAGFEKIEMQFLSDVYVRCPECDGRRYRPEILEVKISPAAPVGACSGGFVGAAAMEGKAAGVSIAEVLDSTIDEAVDFLGGFSDSRAARQARQRLALLQEVGLGYLKVGQPINTLSGGESQRLKLVRHLSETNTGATPAEDGAGRFAGPSFQTWKPTLFLFDEPTTGLHFDDIAILLRVFQRLVDADHSVMVIEHNLEVIKTADWVLDLGPDAGDEGGQVVAKGPPEDIAACEASHTGRALREVLTNKPRRATTRREPAGRAN